MQSNKPYRVVWIGADERLREIEQSLMSGEEARFEFELIYGDKLKRKPDTGVAADVLVVGPELQTPIQTAARLRHGSPGIQIIFHF